MIDIYPPALQTRMKSIGLRTLYSIAEGKDKIRTYVSTGDPQDAWSKISVAYGDPGVALALCMSRNTYLENLAKDYLDESAFSRYEANSNGLLDGGSGYATVCMMCEEIIKYSKYKVIHHRILEGISQALNSSSVEGGIHSRSFDTVYGLAGIARYLLFAVENGLPGEKHLRHILRRLVRWSMGAPPKGYFTPRELVDDSLCRLNPEYCDGYIDIGLAHGIAGPLTILSLAWQNGVRVGAQLEAVEALVETVMKALNSTEWGLSVSYRLSPNKVGGSGLSRTAWCYGNPGVARALSIAGTAYKRKEWIDLAEELIRAVISRPKNKLGISSPMICHGYSGLLLVLNRFIMDPSIKDKTGYQEFAVFCAESIIKEYDSKTPYGFTNSEIGAEDPSLLTGAAGIALALLTAAGITKPTWDILLMLS